MYSIRTVTDYSIIVLSHIPGAVLYRDTYLQYQYIAVLICIADQEPSRVVQ